MSNVLQHSMQSPFNNTSRLVFFGFDPFHLFKGFYTNFINRKVFVLRNLIKETHCWRLDLLIVRKAYKLSDKVLNPTNIKRTNVMIADSLSHELMLSAITVKTGISDSFKLLNYSLSLGQGSIRLT